MVEIVVKQTLKNIKDNPERGIRNLVDMALQFSTGKFEANFFTIIQTMLQNENSAYYDLIRNTVKNTDVERLYTFGMNLGYNGCTEGAKRIRCSEEKLNCNIPWALSLQIDKLTFEEYHEKYDALIYEGESLGIFTWMLFLLNHSAETLSLARTHSDSAFCIFCETEDLTPAFLDEVTKLNNIMLIVHYNENADGFFDTLRKMGLLYSIWFQYGPEDVQAITSGNLFISTQQFSPAFTVLLPEETCPREVRCSVYQAIKRARREQSYQTVVFELQGDSFLIDAIISGDACSIYFDKDGNLCDWEKKLESKHHNLFQNSLIDILTSACSKEST